MTVVDPTTAVFDTIYDFADNELDFDCNSDSDSEFEFEFVHGDDAEPARTYAADDDFVAVGQPLSYAHSLKCGITPSTAPVVYASPRPASPEELDEDEYSDDYDWGYDTDFWGDFCGWWEEIPAGHVGGRGRARLRAPAADADEKYFARRHQHPHQVWWSRATHIRRPDLYWQLRYLYGPPRPATGTGRVGMRVRVCDAQAELARSLASSPAGPRPQQQPAPPVNMPRMLRAAWAGRGESGPARSRGRRKRREKGGG